MKIKSLDHLVLTVKSIQASCDFYESALGMEKVIFGEGRVALKFGEHKINLHEQGKEFEPKAISPSPGSADLCFLVDTHLKDVIQHLTSCDVNIIEGPVQRTGAIGPIVSVYIRDPDGNLLELSNSM